MAKVLVIRLSAIGDVAMTIPVVYSAAWANPQDSFTVLTQTFLMPLFVNHPPNLHVMGMNVKTTEKSVWGLLRYVWILRGYRFDKVLDLHSVIRSWTIDLFFLLSGKKVYKIDKQRRTYKCLSARPPKQIRPLRPVTDRYGDVFRAAGFCFKETFTSLYADNPEDKAWIQTIAGAKKGRWVGIAPFARHAGKIYPLEQMGKVVETLSNEKDITVFLFGGKGKEQELLEAWSRTYPKTFSMAGLFLFDKELAFIYQLDVLVSMDSANMHLASLVGTPVISVWGATHPYAGFYGYRQRKELAVQIDLPCRPCSIYGKKPCYRGDPVCMYNLSPEQISDKVKKFLQNI
jgi:ADP-heptose:LPS heptosyltransferase